MITSKISSKGQVTVPKAVREALGADYGDILTFEIQDGLAILKKIEPFDAAYHAAVSATLTEWTTPEDEEAFGDL